MIPQIGITEFRVKGLVVERETHAPLQARIKAFRSGVTVRRQTSHNSLYGWSEPFEFRLAGPSIRKILSARPIYIPSHRCGRQDHLHNARSVPMAAAPGTGLSHRNSLSSICRRLANTASI